VKVIYVDNNATTQVAPEVLEEMLPYFNEFYGNPSSMHTFGGMVERKIVEAREQHGHSCRNFIESRQETYCNFQGGASGSKKSL
jgi:cysteine sulfinate desulfinase/cysteine desulfurase-like protein